MTRKRRATLVEIARAAKVSATTVSNVVNGKHDMMSDATRRRVEAVIRHFNYRPHEGARTLRLDRRRTIGLIIVDDSPRFLADPMNGNIVAGLSNYLSANGYGLLVMGIREAGVYDAHLVRRDQTDALCVIASGPISERRALYETLRDTGQPLVIFQDEAPDLVEDAFSIRQNDRDAGMCLASRLVERGERRLALLVPSRHWPAIAHRQQGIREVVEATSGARLDVVICGSEAQEDTKLAVARYVEREGLPDVIMGGNDQMAIAAMTWIQDRNLGVPGAVRITGFNGFEFAGYVRPTLTTMSSAAYEMGSEGGALLLRRLADGRFDRRELVFDVSLQAGASG